MEKRLTFRYGRTLIVGRLVAMTVLIVWFAFLVAVLPLAVDFWVFILAIVVGLYVLVFGTSPLLTEHWITRSRLILRQGWYFRAVIPFSDIDRVEVADHFRPLRAPLGIHRPLGQPGLFVTCARTNLVTVHLKEPRRFWQAFGFDAQEIIFDVTDRLRFLDALEERRRLFSPVKSDRPDA